MNNNSPERVTVPSILARKSSANKISALTAYDYTLALLLDQAGVDIILVGDSLGTIVQGHPTTLPVELSHSIYHTECVARAVKHSLLVADLPFLSYQVSPEQAIESAGKLIKAGASAVKLEGGIHMAETVNRIVEVDIPVIGHIGLTPQSFHRMGGNKIQGRRSGSGPGSKDQIIADAVALEEAGVFSIVVEGVPKELAAEITKIVSVPTIGIGASNECDGQILVAHDMLGLLPNFSPRFVKRYAELGEAIKTAIGNYVKDVANGTFPASEHMFSSAQSDKAPNGKSQFIRVN